MSGVEALARALEIGMRGGYVAELPTDLIARQTLAALSPADRLTIAGITEERLAEALCHGRGLPEPPGHRLAHLESARLVLAALTEQEPATPVTPEGGEL